MVAGAPQRRRDGTRCILFGPAAEIEAGARRRAAGGVEVVDAPDGISNDEEPARAVRAKPDASIVQAARAVADGRADALVSAGSTGAALAAGAAAREAAARRLPAGAGGARARPGPPGAAARRRRQRRGAARAPGPVRLHGRRLQQRVLGVERPRVGLLSVGEEPEKGTERWSRRTSASRARPRAFEFVGNVEGDDVPAGERRRRRDRRLHRQRRAEADGGDVATVVGAIRDADPQRHAVEAGRPAAPLERRASCASGSTPSGSAAPTCWACAAWS